MTAETRANLIVLGLVLVLMAPGAVIMFKKKAQPGERPIGSPDPVRRTTAYMDRFPAESVERLAPLRTLEWVSVLAMTDPPPPACAQGGLHRVMWPLSPDTPRVSRLEPTGGSGRVGTSAPFRPIDLGPVQAQVMSAERWFQVVSAASSVQPGRAVLRLVVWDEDVEPFAGRLMAASSGFEAKLLAVHVVAMPRAIRHDLQDAGFVSPPQNVVVLDVEVPAEANEVSLRYEGRFRRADSARFPDLSTYLAVGRSGGGHVSGEESTKGAAGNGSGGRPGSAWPSGPGNSAR